MHISFEELRDIKHSLPTGSIMRIAKELDMTEQSVRNFFGAKKYEDGVIVGKHIQPGPNGGYVELKDTRVLELAKQIIAEGSEVESKLS